MNNSKPSIVMKRSHILHGGIAKQSLRDWHSLNCTIGPKNLMYPVFLVENDDDVQPIESMPGVSRYGLNALIEHLKELVPKGLDSVLLFGVVERLEKDDSGQNADSKDNPVVRALPNLKSHFPTLTLVCDVCLCPYTSHGHCGLLNKDGSINNDASLQRIAEVALAYAKAGADVVAPSDMMDGRIAAIKDILSRNQLSNRVAILSYTAKFASCFYGPFRTAAKAKPAFGDRKCYQLPPGSSGLGIRAAARDVEEGADFLMVKPSLMYLDMIRQIKDAHPEYPLFAYQVSGEYSMICNGANAGAFQLQDGLMEILTSLRRAGADVIISYFTPTILEWLARSKY